MTPTLPRFGQSVRRLLPLAWPVFVGQLAVMALGIVDTVMMGRISPEDLAALSVGQAVYVTLFVGLMGVILAVGPIAGRAFGARDLAGAGMSFVQAQWLALMLAVPGMALMLFPEPFIWLAQLGPEVEAKVRAYLRPMALALPPALLFVAFRGFATSVSRPKAVMLWQLAGLPLKVLLNLLFVQGLGLGLAGCAWATLGVMVVQMAGAQWLLRRDDFYRPFAIAHLWQTRPERARIQGLLKLGVPMGAGILVEVTGFTFMAFFIARLGATPVGGHQIAVNLVSAMFMTALGLGSAAGTLVAQHLGAREPQVARAVGWHALGLSALVAAVLGGSVALLAQPIVGLFTNNAQVAAAALPLLVWVWFFHLGDALQTVAAYVLRAHHVATLPMLAYVLALWGVGIGGGYWLAFAQGQGALGFWRASTFGLVVAAALLIALMAWVHRRDAASG
ncbi:MATE family efflux transporter [Inhella sp.]|uniref:MATE family efflux transporter n=1 Tax=Inhella sp. TaxID=1921806 RepID=UPI0035B29BC6